MATPMSSRGVCAPIAEAGSSAEETSDSQAWRIRLSTASDADAADAAARAREMSTVPSVLLNDGFAPVEASGGGGGVSALGSLLVGRASLAAAPTSGGLREPTRATRADTVSDDDDETDDDDDDEDPVVIIEGAGGARVPAAASGRLSVAHGPYIESERLFFSRPSTAAAPPSASPTASVEVAMSSLSSVASAPAAAAVGRSPSMSVSASVSDSVPGTTLSASLVSFELVYPDGSSSSSPLGMSTASTAHRAKPKFTLYKILVTSMPAESAAAAAAGSHSAAGATTLAAPAAHHVPARSISKLQQLLGADYDRVAAMQGSSANHAGQPPRRSPSLSNGLASLTLAPPSSSSMSHSPSPTASRAHSASPSPMASLSPSSSGSPSPSPSPSPSSPAHSTATAAATTAAAPVLPHAPAAPQSWFIFKRYSDFHALHHRLLSLSSLGGSRNLEGNWLLFLPPKVRAPACFSTGVLETRVSLFDSYVRNLAARDELRAQILVQRFLGLVDDPSERRAAGHRPKQLVSSKLLAKLHGSGAGGGHLMHAADVSASSAAPLFSIPSDALLDFLSTGDLLLFRTSAAISKVQRRFTDSHWDHIAMVIQRPVQSRNKANLCLLESVRRGGVRCHALEGVLGEWRRRGFAKLEKRRAKLLASLAAGAASEDLQHPQSSPFPTIAIRKLYGWHPSPAALARLEEFVDDAIGNAYSIRGVFKLGGKKLRAFMGSSGSGSGGGGSGEYPHGGGGTKEADHHDSSSKSYFCSELVAACYRASGLLPSWCGPESGSSNPLLRKSVSDFLPGDFSTEDASTRHALDQALWESAGVKLGEEIRIDLETAVEEESSVHAPHGPTHQQHQQQQQQHQPQPQAPPHTPATARKMTMDERGSTLSTFESGARRWSADHALAIQSSPGGAGGVVSQGPTSPASADLSYPSSNAVSPDGRYATLATRQAEKAANAAQASVNTTNESDQPPLLSPRPAWEAESEDGSVVDDEGTRSSSLSSLAPRSRMVRLPSDRSSGPSTPLSGASATSPFTSPSAAAGAAGHSSIPIGLASQLVNLDRRSSMPILLAHAEAHPLASSVGSGDARSTPTPSGSSGAPRPTTDSSSPSTPPRMATPDHIVTSVGVDEIRPRHSPTRSDPCAVISMSAARASDRERTDRASASRSKIERLMGVDGDAIARAIAHAAAAAAALATTNANARLRPTSHRVYAHSMDATAMAHAAAAAVAATNKSDLGTGVGESSNLTTPPRSSSNSLVGTPSASIEISQSHTSPIPVRHRSHAKLKALLGASPPPSRGARHLRAALHQHGGGGGGKGSQAKIAALMGGDALGGGGGSSHTPTTTAPSHDASPTDEDMWASATSRVWPRRRSEEESVEFDFDAPISRARTRTAFSRQSSLEGHQEIARGLIASTTFGTAVSGTTNPTAAASNSAAPSPSPSPAAAAVPTATAPSPTPSPTADRRPTDEARASPSAARYAIESMVDDTPVGVELELLPLGRSRTSDAAAVDAEPDCDVFAASPPPSRTRGGTLAPPMPAGLTFASASPPSPQCALTTSSSAGSQEGHLIAQIEIVEDFIR